MEEETKNETIDNSFTSMYMDNAISRTKFPVYQITDMSNGTVYAMKTFPQDQKRSLFYENEKRFAVYNHKHLITAKHFEDDANIDIDGKNTKVSYLIMEYASKGNFFMFIKNHADKLNEKLARTYFRQLIDGIEYLHMNYAAHLDLKPENLLIGDDYNLKIADFDTSWIHGDCKVLAKGTKYKRAPELILKKCENKYAADIFSAGIILFLMKTGGKLPQAEDATHNGINLYQYMQHHNDKFWEIHCKMQNKDMNFFNKDFRDLFNKMTRENPDARASIKDIKASNWYNGEVYTEQELVEYIMWVLGETPKFNDQQPQEQYYDNSYYNNSNVSNYYNQPVDFAEEWNYSHY